MFGRICASHPVLNGNAKVLSANRHRPQNAVVFEPQRPDSDTPSGPLELTLTVTAIAGSDLPEVAARPRRVRRWLRVVGWAEVGLLITTMTAATRYVADHHHVHNGANPIPASSYTLPPVPPGTTPPQDHSGDLRRFLVARPDDARQNFEPRATDGAMSLQQVASYYDDPEAAEKFLASEGFIAAATVNWIDLAGNQVEIRMARFGSPNQAWAVFNRDFENVSQETELAGATSSVPLKIGYSNAGIFTNNTKNTGGNQLSRAVALRGDVMFNIWIYQKAPQSPMLTQALLYQQWSSL